MSDGTLVLVGTPIGNLGDLSPRAVEELGAADVICCEDTRRTGKLLQHAGLRRPRMVVVNQHTEAQEVTRVLELLAGGQRVALVSDAGMPGISDPGERLVAAAVEAGHPVEVIPGPAAVIAALVVSGLPTERVAFDGFLPRRGSERKQRLAEVAGERRTVVLYEAPHRVARTLEDLAEACGPARQVAVARELTKLHEETWRGTLGAAAEWAERSQPPGELVLVLEGAPPAPTVDDEMVREAVTAAMADGSSVRDAAAQVASELGVPKRRAYQLALEAR